MGIISSIGAFSKANDYYDKLKSDNWAGRGRHGTTWNGESIRAKFLKQHTVLSGIYMLGKFRTIEPRLLTAARLGASPILSNTTFGKIAKVGLDVLRLGQSYGARTEFSDVPITSNPIERVKSLFKTDHGDGTTRSLRKRYGLDYKTDKSYGTISEKGIWVDTWDGKDLIPVIFKSSTNTLRFRGMIAGLSDSITPTWNETTYVGRPDPMMSYAGFAREISFDLTCAAVNPQMLRPMYVMISRLAQHVLPKRDHSAYTGARYSGNLANVTIGNYLENELCAVTGMTLTPNEEAMWEIADPEFNYPDLTQMHDIMGEVAGNLKEKLKQIKEQKAQGENYVKPPKKLTRKEREAKTKHNFKVPRIITINITLKVLHNDIPGEGGKPLFNIQGLEDTHAVISTKEDNKKDAINNQEVKTDGGSGE